MDQEKYGLIGHPIHQSLSPKLFEAAYGGTLPYDLIEGEDFEESFGKFLDGYHAINVTAPFKEKSYDKVLSLAREGKGMISGPCFKIKATNLLVKTAEGIEAHNSDFTGIILTVAEAFFPGIVAQCYSRFGANAYKQVHQFMRISLGDIFSEKPQALIVGAGGAGKAAAVAAAEMGFDVAIMNRTASKAQAIADSLPEYSFIVTPVSDFKGALKECDLVIYTLPMKLDAIDSLKVSDFEGEDRYSTGNPGKVILEANYKNPSFGEESLAKMEMAGCQYISGRRWLEYQAVTGYSIMTGKQPDIKSILSALD